MSATISNVVPFSDNTRARQSDNKALAESYAELGVAIFPSSGKTPLIPLFNRLDTEITPAEREAAIAKYREDHDKAPIHVGATKDRLVVRRMWRAFRDAVPSIACGPTGIVVIDADAKDDGPEKIGALFEENGGLPEGCISSPTKSGGKHFIFADPDRTFTNKAGLLKKQYGCDVRGAGGQIVAPGAQLEDGRTYGTMDDFGRLGRAIAKKTLTAPPQYLTALIGAWNGQPEGETVSPSKEREVIDALSNADWESVENDFDPILGKYDLGKLKDENAEFKKLYDEPGSDCSTNRFLAARHVMREWPDMPAPSLSIFFSQWEGSGQYTDEKPKTGEYDDRQIAREWIKNQGLSKPSTGDAFGAVIDEDDQPLEVGDRDKGFVYIENIRGAVLPVLDWRIKYFVARGTTSVATGMWGTGKTAVFSDIGLHVGHGFEWRGRKVAKGVVIYVALENSDDVERRVATWCDIMERAGRDLTGGAFVVHRGPCRLFDPSGKPTRDEKKLIEIANTAASHYGLPVAMIVIDTLAQSIMPGNDNDAKDAGIYTAAMQRIVAATGANVTALAHPTKDGKVGVRGSGALQANVDTVIEISKDAAGRGTIKAGSKFRIGNPSKVNFGYRLKSHVVGKDDDGDYIDVVLAVEGQTGPNLAVVDDGDDDATLTPPDTPADRLAATLKVFKECVEHLSNATGKPISEISVMAKDIFAGLNRDRRGCGLTEIKDRTALSRLLGRLVERSEIVRSGDNRRTEYRLIE